jgi:hypothetical protein
MVIKVQITTKDGRLAELRFRANRRVAVRESDLPSPPPREIALMCMGERIEARLVARQFGFAVYYMPAHAEERLAELIEKYGEVPCVLVF